MARTAEGPDKVVMKIRLDVYLTCEEVQRYSRIADLEGTNLSGWLSGAAYFGIREVGELAIVKQEKQG